MFYNVLRKLQAHCSGALNFDSFIECELCEGISGKLNPLTCFACPNGLAKLYIYISFITPKQHKVKKNTHENIQTYMHTC